MGKSDRKSSRLANCGGNGLSADALARPEAGIDARGMPSSSSSKKVCPDEALGAVDGEGKKLGNSEDLCGEGAGLLFDGGMEEDVEGPASLKRE